MVEKNQEKIPINNNDNSRSFDELIKTHLDLVYNYTLRILKNTHNAQDVTQQTFVKAWKNFKKFKKDKNFKVWILSIARNTAIDLLRKNKELSFVDFEDSEGNNPITESIQDTQELPDKLIDLAQERKIIERAFDSLSPQYKDVLILHYTNELTFEEISKIKGGSINTIKSHHHRAILALRKSLTDKLL